MQVLPQCILTRAGERDVVITPVVQMETKALRAVASPSCPSGPPAALAQHRQVCWNCIDVERVEVFMGIKILLFHLLLQQLSPPGWWGPPPQADLSVFPVSWSPLALLIAHLAGAHLEVGRRWECVFRCFAQSPLSWVRAQW